jgi:hypothetical protein
MEGYMSSNEPASGISSPCKDLLQLQTACNQQEIEDHLDLLMVAAWYGGCHKLNT